MSPSARAPTKNHKPGASLFLLLLLLAPLVASPAAIAEQTIDLAFLARHFDETRGAAYAFHRSRTDWEPVTEARYVDWNLGVRSRIDFEEQTSVEIDGRIGFDLAAADRAAQQNRERWLEAEVARLDLLDSILDDQYLLAQQLCTLAASEQQRAILQRLRELATTPTEAQYWQGQLAQLSFEADVALDLLRSFGIPLPSNNAIYVCAPEAFDDVAFLEPHPSLRRQSLEHERNALLERFFRPLPRQEVFVEAFAGLPLGATDASFFSSSTFTLRIGANLPVTLAGAMANFDVSSDLDSVGVGVRISPNRNDLPATARPRNDLQNLRRDLELSVEQQRLYHRSISLHNTLTWERLRAGYTLPTSCAAWGCLAQLEQVEDPALLLELLTLSMQTLEQKRAYLSLLRLLYVPILGVSPGFAAAIEAPNSPGP